MNAHSLSCVQLFATPWTVAHQTPRSIEFSRQEYWRRLSFLSPEDLPDPRIEPLSLASPALAGRYFIAVPPGKPNNNILRILYNGEYARDTNLYPEFFPT